MKRIPTEADLEQIKAAMTAVEGVTAVRVSVVVMVHTDVEDEAARERVYAAEATLMGEIALHEHSFDFRTHMPMPGVGTVADLRRVSDNINYANVREDGHTYVRSERGEVAGGWSKVVSS